VKHPFDHAWDRNLADFAAQVECRDLVFQDLPNRKVVNSRLRNRCVRCQVFRWRFERLIGLKLMEVSLAVLVERHGVLLHLPLLIVEKDLIEPRVWRV
jgi:hypothetical protein